MVDYDATATAFSSGKTLVLRTAEAESGPMMKWDGPGWSPSQHGGDHIGLRTAIIEHQQNVGAEGRLAVISQNGTTTVHSAELGPDGMTTYTYQKNPPIET